MGRLWKRLKGPRNSRRIVVATVTASVGMCCVALLARGVAQLRVPQIPEALSSGRARAPGAYTDSARLSRALPASAATNAREVGEQVLSRNIFDSVTGALAWQPANAASDLDASAESDAEVAPSGARCSGDLRLLASVVNGRDPQRSIAALRKDGKTHLMAVGERVGELELVLLQPTEAFFRNGQSTCSLPVYLSANAAPPPLPPAPEPPAPVAADEARAARARAKRPPAFSEDELKHNIRVLGPARYAVTRELFARARMNPSGISRGARFKPQQRDGRSSGMQVSVLREDSLLAHLGVKQGDVLRGINGFGLGSADGVLEAFGHLGKNNQVSLSIERGGALTTIEYVLE